MSRTPEASLPIDVHIGADHPNEQIFRTVFAHSQPSPNGECSDD
jgi:hypothetical protein